MINVYDRVHETSTTEGTGPFYLNGAADGYRSFRDVVPNNQQVYYVITFGNIWEVGVGRYQSQTNSLLRENVTSSSAATIATKVNFPEGTKHIFIATTAAAYTDLSSLIDGINIQDLTSSITNSITSSYGLPENVAKRNTPQTFTDVQTFGAAVKEKSINLIGNVIDLSLGNVFVKAITGSTAFSVINTSQSGVVVGIVLKLTNGGQHIISWFNNIVWVGGVQPTLTFSGTDLLGFISHDGGVNWTGLVMGKDVR